jgi:transposase, IS5 family
MYGKMGEHRKKLAPKPAYISPNQMTLVGFETPFEQHLRADNRWVVLARLIPWDDLSNIYLKHVGVSGMGPKPINPRIVIGALIIKHMEDLDDREVVAQVSENVYMQYFLGYSSFNPDPPFDASLFVEIRKRLGFEAVNALNEKIIAIKTRMESPSQCTEPADEPSATDAEVISETSDESDNASTLDNSEMPTKAELDEIQADTCNAKEESSPSSKNKTKNKETQHHDSPKKNKGRVIFDATACPQDIAYPNDLNLLSESRKKSEYLVDILYKPELHSSKPRTYRKNARKEYLKTAMKKNKSKKELRRALKKQLSYLKRNITSIDKLLDAYETIPLNSKDYKYMLVIRTLYDQQETMYQTKTHTIEHRIVSIHQPHVRPIVRGKAHARVEFGPKIHISVIDGITFLDEISWDAYNEGTHMMDYLEKYYQRFGFYPLEVLADKLYCTRVNREKLKGKGIKLVGKPLGRPTAVTVHISPGERNPVEGKFGQAKTAYGLGRIRARLKETSESWIASIILVLNLVKLAGAVPYYLYRRYSAKISHTLILILAQILWKVIFKNYLPLARIFNPRGA